MMCDSDELRMVMPGLLLADGSIDDTAYGEGEDEEPPCLRMMRIENGRRGSCYYEPESDVLRALLPPTPFAASSERCACHTVSHRVGSRPPGRQCVLGRTA